ncbi:protein tyrosine phosphatase type IVA 3-like [Aduncisulcus paluster]|uniref:Protein tyrosine phosphatase type IVA 3-like n=1 Tax=Aduncisulcus paluster TaxID=2918883 RepID=A0ABQ5K247_9EUKA|nr:protein tyrosine phosphatase type IVA 3-like [Aduncisulcus paluster]|eukprot:gnl/Carplike_NY0171/696_a963_1986.p1 GENE.gnl/Carplike_NY0171/696_a963_1986~~gnl/Carplike_NY0171/696_a963_1986.p1  ORF type:complete len:175 (-),score=26.84 gnl/Carplike_NY0171/696_a963_1986:90-614(-)
MSSLVVNPNVITGFGMRFLLCDSPKDDHMDDFVQIFVKNKVKKVVRLTNPTYSTKMLNAKGISVIDLSFPDGSLPTEELLASWREIVADIFPPEQVEAKSKISGPAEGHSLCVHCLASLGRAPVLVAVALIDRGFDQTDVIQHIRKVRRGCFNRSQIDWLLSYSPPSSTGCFIV